MQIQLLTVADTHPSNQSADRIFIEDISDHAVGFTLIKTTLVATGDDATGILASVLQ